MFTYACTTNDGNREINEDSLIALEKDGMGCFVVADGLGGHDLGEVASKLAVESFFDAFTLYKGEVSEADFLNETFLKAQQRIVEEQDVRHAPDKMKTTCVALMLTGEKAVWGHVGDSRLYAFKRNKVKTHTLDHSVPQMLVMAGDIKEKQIRNHPDRNRLLRVLGIPWDRSMQEISEPQSAGDFQAFLLCTDGFWELVDEKTMCKLLKKSASVSEWLEAMKSEVEKNGAGHDMDNYTALAIWC